MSSWLRNGFGLVGLAIGLVLAANSVSASSPNATAKGDTCVPPTSNCFSSTTFTSAGYSEFRGRMAYTTMGTIQSMSEEQLIARFQAEFIVAVDVEPYSHGPSSSTSPSVTTVRGQNIGF